MPEINITPAELQQVKEALHLERVPIYKASKKGQTITVVTRFGTESYELPKPKPKPKPKPRPKPRPKAKAQEKKGGD